MSIRESCIKNLPNVRGERVLVNHYWIRWHKRSEVQLWFPQLKRMAERKEVRLICHRFILKVLIELAS